MAISELDPTLTRAMRSPARLTRAERAVRNEAYLAAMKVRGSELVAREGMQGMKRLDVERQELADDLFQEALLLEIENGHLGVVRRVQADLYFWG